MVDRNKSLLASLVDRSGHELRESNQPRQHYKYLISQANALPGKMRTIIREYNRAALEKEQHEIMEQFQGKQQRLKQVRTRLKQEMTEREDDQQDSEYLYIKEELLKVVKAEMNIEMDMNDNVTREKRKKEALQKNLTAGSTRLQNALRDIEQKRQEIIYLEEGIQECLTLLEAIGILVHEQGLKINEVRVNVKEANVALELAEKNINKAKINQRKSQKKCCCILVLALIAIILVVVLLFATKVISL